ncbi:hypothetical protein CC78DRAFT_385311 [Lojkania enalia]|uniref:Uncharacterized protein n=1 Tax=Lojkania enalia TaxID=147567 RepID=A0A9P4K1A9_9PLEO|nr:hypothetical protein CC78DRAFT_385311 [Didymosphaeria enalia]
MPRRQTITISRPFDARHVAGVGVTGTLPIASMQRSTIQPDEIFTHTNVDGEAPKRSQSLARSLGRPSLRLRTSLSRLAARSGRSRSPSSSPESTRNKNPTSSASPEPQRPSLPPLQLQTPPPQRSHKDIVQTRPPTRPKRKDSGTAIDFSDIPVSERPLGFREIMEVAGFEERMAAYRQAREYWAGADHGLGAWVEGAVGRRAMRV